MGLFPEHIKISIGVYVEQFVIWITKNYAGVFESIKHMILKFLLVTQGALLSVPWILVIGLVVIVGWKFKNIKSGILYGGMIFLIGGFGLWEEMMITLAIVLTSVIISLIIGIPFGILIAYKKRVETITRPLLDAMQTMPSFVYLIPAIMLFGLGMVPAVFATTIYSLPPVIRLTNLAIKSVSKEMIEASNSFGASTMQTLLKVEIPQAMPTIMTGINQTTMMAMAMVVVSSMIGAKGLGMNVINAINRIDIGMGFEAGLSIVFLAIIIDRLTQSVADKFKYDR
ncbi:MAG: proline/glycine betaine ABC transporter permease [Anaeromicrobium sp.]|jgi:glycine betaine/proline transport system permease protein|uniref:ABC transporter permease n=1 Tax=Anaeromicrobium sp. TaxID=1929132 RepID=UPI0025E63B8E|nr:proline/glycine betaine ABC transporter permease [Anaeromicrobium sp.]MCT4596126.1 proline/glycine betaine ABC transporter permease [Anaeromicrobium sp.]